VEEVVGEDDEGDEEVVGEQAQACSIPLAVLSPDLQRRAVKALTREIRPLLLLTQSAPISLSKKKRFSMDGESL